MARLFSFRFYLVLICFSQMLHANDHLVPISREAFEYISPFIKYSLNEIQFVDGAQWPSACGDTNNSILSKKRDDIRSYYLRVSVECDALLRQLKNQKARKKINMIPLRISNPMQLKFDRTEVPSFAIENADLEKRVNTKSNCDLTSTDYLANIKAVAAQMALDSSYVPIQSSDGKIYYVQISPVTEGQKGSGVEEAFANIYHDRNKKSAASASSAPTSMSGVSSEVALGNTGNGQVAATCDSPHEKGSIANQYCQAVVTNGVRVFLENKAGMKSTLAHAVGSSVYISRDILNNRKVGLNNVAVVNVNIFNELGVQVDQKVLGTVFGDGSFYLMWQKDLN